MAMAEDGTRELALEQRDDPEAPTDDDPEHTASD